MQAAVDTIQNGYRFTNIYNVRPVTDTLEEIVAKLDDEARNRSASISISEDEILLQVQDVEKELIGLISVQAGSVTALVEGGGSTGQMSLSLNLPIMIDATRRAQLIAASTEAKVNAVYGLLDNSDYYGIKGNASNAAIKALWDDAVTAGLIASQIDLTATQISINAANVKIDGETIINNASKIKASLIEVENLLASSVTVKDKGVIKSANYNGTIDSNGNITAYGSAGWAIDHAGKSDFVDINATGGVYNNILANSLLVKNGLRLKTLIGGDYLSGLRNTLFNAISNYPKYGTAENTYSCAGNIWAITDTMTLNYGASGYEIVWSGKTKTGVLIRGTKTANIIDSSLPLGFKIELINGVQLLQSGSNKIYSISGAYYDLPAATHSSIFI